MSEEREEWEPEFYPVLSTEYSGLEQVGLIPKSLKDKPDLTETDFEEMILLLEEGEPAAQIPGRRRKIQFDFERCYQLAETGVSATEVAEIMAVEVHVVHNNIRARYGFGWKEYAERATKSLDGEFRRRLITAIRKGNDKLLITYAQKFLGWGMTTKVELTGQDGGPLRQQAVLVTMSAEELMKRRQALTRVIDRKPKFGETGKLSETLTLMEKS